MEVENSKNFLGILLCSIDIVHIIDVKNIKEFIIKNIFPNIDFNNKNVLRGIIGFIIVSSIEILHLIINYPEIFNIESDDIIRRAYNYLDELKEIGDVSNSDQARLIRTYYQLIRNIRKSTSIEELNSNVERIRVFASHLGEVIEKNVLCYRNNDKLDVFQDNLGKRRISFGLMSFVHDVNNSLIHNFNKANFDFKLDIKFLKGFIGSLIYSWQFGLKSSDWDIFLSKLVPRMTEVESWDDFTPFFSELRGLFPFISDYYSKIWGGEISYKIIDLKPKSLPKNVFTKRIEINPRLDRVFLWYPVQVLTKDNFILGGSFWRLIIKGFLQIDEEFNYIPELTLFFHPWDDEHILTECSQNLEQKLRICGLDPKGGDVYSLSVAFFLPAYGTVFSNPSCWLVLHDIACNWLGDGQGTVNLYKNILEDINLWKNKLKLNFYEIGSRLLRNYSLSRSEKELIEIRNKESNIQKDIRGTIAEIILGWKYLNDGWKVKTNVKFHNRELDVFCWKKEKGCLKVIIAECKDYSRSKSVNLYDFDGLIERINFLGQNEVKSLLNLLNISNKSNLTIKHILAIFALEKRLKKDTDIIDCKKVRKYIDSRIEDRKDWELIEPWITNKWSKEYNFPKKLVKPLKLLLSAKKRAYNLKDSELMNLTDIIDFN